MPYNKYVAGRKCITGPKRASGKNSAQCWRCAFVLSPQAVDLPEKSACAYDESMTGQTIYAYVGGSPISSTDPEGLWVNIVGGGLIGGLGNLGYQLYQNDGDFKCVDLGEVGSWAAAGALAGALVPEGLLARAGMQTVSRWGPSGSWVMTGGSSVRNWVMSGSPGRYALGDVVTT